MVSPVCSNPSSLPCLMDLEEVSRGVPLVPSSHSATAVVSSVFQRTVQNDANLGNELFQGKLFFREEEWHYETPFKKEVYSDLSACMESIAQGGICPLTELDISGVDSASIDELLFLIGKCPYLRVLNLRGIQDPRLNNLLRAVANNCPSLQELDLRNCPQILDVFLEMVIQNCLDLRYLDVSYCKLLTGRFCVSIAHFSRKLEVLGLNRVDQVGEDGKKLGPMFCMRGKGLSDVLKNNPNLIKLYLSGQSRELLGLGMKEEASFRIVELILDSCPKLQFLDVSECDWAKGILSRIGSRCSSLRGLCLRGSAAEGICDQDLIALSQNCRKLKGLYLELSQGAISDAGIESLALHCPFLTHLTIKGIRGVTASSLQALQSHCPKLEILNLKQSSLKEGDREIEEEEMVQFLKGMESMKALSLQGFSKITPALFLKVPERFANWKGLSLRNCGRQGDRRDLSEIVMRSVAEHCPQIVELDFSNCPQLRFNVDSLVCLIGRCEALKNISLSPFEVEDLSEEFLKIFRYRIPELKSLKLGPYKINLKEFEKAL